jgi:hypothetical protein
MRRVLTTVLAELAQSCVKAFIGIAVYGIPVTVALMAWKH